MEYSKVGTTVYPIIMFSSLTTSSNSKQGASRTRNNLTTRTTRALHPGTISLARTSRGSS